MQGAGSGGWLSGGQNQGSVKLSLDLAIGETNAIKKGDEGKVGELAQKVRDLNGRLMDIRREQVFQRVSEAPLHHRKHAVFVKCLTECLNDRSVRRSSGICQRAPTPGLSGGLCCSWLYLVLHARGSFRIYGRSSSNKSLHDHQEIDEYEAYLKRKIFPLSQAFIFTSSALANIDAFKLFHIHVVLAN